MSESDVKNNVYVTSSGLEIEFDPISMTTMMLAAQGVERSFRAKGEPIDAPTYTVEVVGGDTEEYTLDETILEVEGNDEETTRRKVAWNKHQAAISRMESEKQRVQSYILMDALKIELPEDDMWIRRQESLYIEVPTDPLERHRHYIQTEILRSVSDLINLTTAVLEYSAAGIIDEEELAAAKAAFKSRVRENLQGRKSSRDNADRVDEKDKPEHGMEILNVVRPVARNKRVAEKTE